MNATSSNPPSPYQDTAAERRARWLAVVVFGCFLLSFLSFGVMSMRLGGSPDGWTMPEAGPYVITDHGRETEVSRATYAYLLWHSRLVLGGAPIGFVAFVIMAALFDRRQKHQLFLRAGRKAWRERSEAQVTQPK